MLKKMMLICLCAVSALVVSAAEAGSKEAVMEKFMVSLASADVNALWDVFSPASKSAAIKECGSEAGAKVVIQKALNAENAVKARKDVAVILADPAAKKDAIARAVAYSELWENVDGKWFINAEKLVQE